MMRPGLYIAYGMSGRGVFTSQPIGAGELIEVAPILRVRYDGVPALQDYVFADCLDDDQYCSIGLGYSSLYNHAPSTLANVSLNYGKTELIMESKRDIAAHEELRHDYGSEWWELRGYERTADNIANREGSWRARIRRFLKGKN